MIMILNQDLWDMIAIVIVLDSLHQDFDTILASLLETGNKFIDKIKRILQPKEVKNLSKWVTENTGNLAIGFREKISSIKRKVTNKDKYYNCYIFGYFGCDCFLFDRRLNKTGNTQQSQIDNSRRSDSYRREIQYRGQIGG